MEQHEILSISGDWTRGVAEPDAFKHEQKCLAHVWTFLGLASDVATDGDWFTASIATRSVFVQRFGGDIRGFENRCAHRHYPLRNAERGNGPVICGYHQWQYDSEGHAVLIPHCRELFDAIPLELGARLNRVEIATCGTLVFGRFAVPGVDTTLEDFLGEGFAILAAISQAKGRPQLLTRRVKANWRLCLHITLDDYHAVAVHPSTLGRHGYLHRDKISYVRFGSHSAYLNTTRPQALQQMAVNCRNGTFEPTHYCIFQIVPNMVVSLVRTGAWFFHCLIAVYEPSRHDQTTVRSWLFPAPFITRHAWLGGLTNPLRTPIISYYLRKVFREDDVVSERIQAASHQIDGAPLLGKLEERIVWFEESCRQLVAEGESLQASIAATRGR